MVLQHHSTGATSWENALLRHAWSTTEYAYDLSAMNRAAARKLGARSTRLIIRLGRAARNDLRSRNTRWFYLCSMLCATVGGWLGADLGEVAGGILGLAVHGPIGGWVAEGGGAVVGAFVGGYLGKVAGKYISTCVGKLRTWWTMRQSDTEITRV
ncbi:hypothetical protein AAVH_17337 [Aphelenchoides avenae]|nr:hypothetical protein AAVH_17337 [Aphelenchus avenae]